MAELDLSSIMDALSNSLIDGNVIKRVYPWPAENVTVPCAIIGYPQEPLEFDVTFGRGSDRIVIPIFFVAGKVSDRTARDDLSRIIAGFRSVKEAIDGNLAGTVQTARVVNCQIQPITVAGTEYISAVFAVEIYT